MGAARPYPAGVDQEIYALLVTHQLLRTAIAGGITAADHANLAGAIGRRALAALLPVRR